MDVDDRVHGCRNCEGQEDPEVVQVEAEVLVGRVDPALELIC